jgi:putative oxidoreductase
MTSSKKDIAVLIVRLIIGGIFIFSGWMKISDMTMTVGFFGTLGIPAFLAYIVGYAEFIGGILLVIGLWTCISSIVLGIIMIVAVILTVSAGPSMFMTPLVTLAGLISILGSGAGRFAIRCKKPSATSATPVQ